MLLTCFQLRVIKCPGYKAEITYFPSTRCAPDDDINGQNTKGVFVIASSKTAQRKMLNVTGKCMLR